MYVWGRVESYSYDDIAKKGGDWSLAQTQKTTSFFHPHCWGVGFSEAHLFWRELFKTVQNDPDSELTVKYYVYGIQCRHPNMPCLWLILGMT